MDAMYKMSKDEELSQELVIDILNKNFWGEGGNYKYPKYKSKNIGISTMSC